MRRLKFLFLCIVLLSGSPAHAALERDAINVLADESLTLPLTEISRRFSLLHHIPVTCAFSSPLVSLHQIEEGESADVFITSYLSLLEQLRRKGLVDVYSQRRITGARLAFMKLKDTPVNESLLAVVIPSPTLNAEGQIAEPYLQSLRPVPHIVYAASGTELPDEMEKLKLPGITYETEPHRLSRLAPDGVRVKSPLPVASFDAVVVAGENMNNSRVFLDFLMSEEARAVWTRYGFGAE
jgi:molybdate transport system substrate-binding protein